MRHFYETYRDAPDLSTLLRDLPWSANLHILSGAKTPEAREFYLRMATGRHWNVRELARQIGASAFERSVLGRPKLSTSLREMHPQVASDFKDVYSLEFADLANGHSEADLHGALLRNLGRFITELGRDFCFVSSEYPLQVGNQDFAIDLVFFQRHRIPGGPFYGQVQQRGFPALLVWPLPVRHDAPPGNVLHRLSPLARTPIPFRRADS